MLDWLYFTPKYYIKLFIQKLLRGFSDVEIWNLDYTFYEWILPRLKRFRKVAIKIGYPNSYPSPKAWNEQLDLRIQQLEVIIKVNHQQPLILGEVKILEEYFDEKLFMEKYSNIPNDEEFRKNIKMNFEIDRLKKDFLNWFMEESQHLWF